jgi:hypothetical protein
MKERRASGESNPNMNFQNIKDIQNRNILANNIQNFS